MLNKIIHPEVSRQIKNKITVLKKKKTPVVVLDIPLLLETGMDSLCDEILLAYAPEPMMRERLKLRNQFSDQEIEQRITSQLSITEKKKRANVVIDNSGSLENTKKQVEKYCRGLSPFES